MCLCSAEQEPVDIRKGLSREAALRMAKNLGFKDGQEATTVRDVRLFLSNQSLPLTHINAI